MSFSAADIRPSVERLLPFHAVLDGLASRPSQEVAFRFLVDGDREEITLTYAEMALRARASAQTLLDLGATGRPVLLMRPPGLEYIEGLFACWYAGAIAVPAYPPRGTKHRKRLEAILPDSKAGIALICPEQTAPEGTCPVLPADPEHLSSNREFPIISPSDVCLIQYTSGSTADPKGVMLTHQNFRSHFAYFSCEGSPRYQSILSWLPPYHDMGLVLKILHAIELGVPITFFAPEQFIRQPAKWLRAISHYGADFSGGPNFAYDLCTSSIRDEEMDGVDLSCWKAAACGAERIHPETLRRFATRFSKWGFSENAFAPGYGLAETTLAVTGKLTADFPQISTLHRDSGLVSNGQPLPGVSLSIIDPEDNRPLTAGSIGEIVVKGPMVSPGYWGNLQATKEVFSEHGLKTGDLGYLEDNELYVIGRIKDLVIIDGTNHSPEDIESVIVSSSDSIKASAVFAMEVDGRESVVAVVESPRLPDADRDELCHHIRHQVGEMLELPIARILFTRPGLIPRTTSGKIRRSACRDAVLSGSLSLHFEDSHSPRTAQAATGCAQTALLLDLIFSVTGGHRASASDDPIELGLSSMDMMRLSGLIEEKTGVSIPIKDLFGARSIAEVAAVIVENFGKSTPPLRIEAGAGAKAGIMTHAQERMWFLHQFDPESAAYHIFGTVVLEGQLDPNLIENALRLVVSRHDILRSRHGTENGRSKVWIEPNDRLPFSIHPRCEESEIEPLLQSFGSRPFALAYESPIRALLIPTGQEKHLLALCLHHIVADGWSMRLLASEIADVYGAMAAGRVLDPTPKSPGYLDYALSHRQWIESGAVDHQINYWKNQLEGHSGVLQLATDFPRPQKQSSSGRLVKIDLSAEICSKVAVLAKRLRGTPFMVHLAVFLLLLRRHGAGDDPVVAIPVANRNHAASAELIGTLVNTLPFRMNLVPGETFITLLERVREATFGMQAAQDAPFEKIIDAVNPDRSTDHSPLAQVMFDHQELPLAETWAGGLRCTPHISHRGAAQFDLSLLLTAYGDRQSLAMEYRSDLFLESSIERMLSRYVETLSTLIDHPDCGVSEVTTLTATDESRLHILQQGPARPRFLGRTTPEMIHQTTIRHAQKTAVACGKESLDYAGLDHVASRICGALQEAGVSSGDHVAILCHRDHLLPAALLGIWKAGAAYVPLDAANPPERLKLILEDQFPIRVLAHAELRHLLPDEVEVIDIEEAVSAPHAGSESTPSPSAPAYVIYTSGSTGRPKGVVVSHGALANFLLSMAEAPGFTEADRVLAVTTVSFDISTLELFLPLICGGSLEVVPKSVSTDGHALASCLKSSGATVMQATPATWRLLLECGWAVCPDLKMLCGGEALDLSLASKLTSNGAQLWNMYGPTETTVWSTIWRVPPAPKSIRIGTPIANTGIHILAQDGAELPPGVTGDLWISGAGLADGYWQRPELTESSFVKNHEGATRYKTGDLARWMPDGTLECLGRSDGQIKIRGFRVELGEIEAALSGYPPIAQAKVEFRGKDSSTKKLIAWVTLRKRETVDLSAFRDYLSSQLPPYMLPAHIAVIEKFPLGSSGKVDVSKLELPVSDPVPTSPMTPGERQLAEIWSELLGKSPIHKDDDWFHSGGHSLLALRLFARIRQDLHRTLPLSTILDHPTLEGLAARIHETQPDTPAS